MATTGRVSALNIGDIFLVSLPVGYANGNLGYLYTNQTFKEGGYEVDAAYRLYGERQADLGAARALAAPKKPSPHSKSRSQYKCRIVPSTRR